MNEHARPPRIKSLTPMLVVESVERARDFYCQKLGFDCLNSMEWEGKLGWCILGTGGTRPGWAKANTDPKDVPCNVEIMLSADGGECVGSCRATRRGVIMYFYPEDVVALHGVFKSRGAPVSELRTTFYHMTEFTVEDPDGYQLWFGAATAESAAAGKT